MPIGTLPNPTALQGSTALTTFKVEADDNLLVGVISIQINMALNTIPKAYIVLDDGDIAQQTFEQSEQEFTIPGKSIRISCGYNSDEDILFEGEVVKQKIKVTASGKTQLELICKDPCYKMAIDKKSNYFENVSEQSILDELVNNYDGINANYDTISLSEVSQINYSSLIQHNISDWDYLISRLEQSSSFAIVNNGTIEVKGIPTYTVAAFGLEFGRDVINMDLELDSQAQHSQITSEAWDETTQEIVQATSTSSSLANQGNVGTDTLSNTNQSSFKIKHSGNVSNEQLQQWANSKKLRSELSRITGHISFQGSVLPTLNEYITIGGISSRFNGPCLITAINHKIVSGDWVTQVKIGLSPFSHSDRHQEKEKVENMTSGAISGFYTGIVKQVADDPEENLRILVNIPTIQSNEEATWMRLASLDASETKGFVNRPDKEDEVLVGFLNNDVNQGVVLGALFSKKYPGSTLLEPTEENNKKGWVIKEDMHLIFDSKDDIVELVTAKGNSIRIDQEIIEISDQFSNKLIMDSNGIELKSDGNIKLTASSGDIVINGKSIDLSATSSLNAKGGTATLEGSSSTAIKGSMVQIN